MSLKQRPTPSMTVQEELITEAIGQDQGNVRLRLQKTKGEPIRKRNIQESEAKTFSGGGLTQKEKGSPPKHGRLLQSSTEQESARIAEYFEKNDEISQMVYATLDAYNNGAFKQRFKVYSRAEVMKILDGHEEGNDEEKEEGEPLDEKKELVSNWTAGAAGVDGNDDLPRTLYRWQEDTTRTIEDKR